MRNKVKKLIRQTERAVRRDLLPHQEAWNRAVTAFTNPEDRDAMVRTIIRALATDNLTPPEAATMLDILGENQLENPPAEDGWAQGSTFAQRYVVLNLAGALAQQHLEAFDAMTYGEKFEEIDPRRD